MRLIRRSTMALTALLATGLAVGAVAGPANAIVPGSTPPTAALSPQSAAGFAAAAPPTGLRAPWSRETVHYGQRDLDPYHISHVLELQYRLKWVGLFNATPTGYFGTVTRAAVRAYQARRHLPQTGVMNAATWKPLLQHTVKRPAFAPDVCRRDGWHACYDRTMHQVTLWHDGSIDNNWLVRGGASTMQTRLGTHVVYYRDIDHVSSQYGSPMPYSQFFDGGEALHGSRLMMSPFVDHSHGCINMYVEDARQLWNLTHDKRLVVTVYGAWS